MVSSQLIVRSSAASLFSFALPPRENRSTAQLVRTLDDLSANASKRRALVVDDVADVTYMLSVLLTRAGYDVVTADSASAALNLAKKERFDVVISDIGMPEMNGYELVKALRVVPGYEHIPMVALTGYSMFNDREQSLRSGFTAHVTKPIDPRALLNLIDQL